MGEEKRMEKEKVLDRIAKILALRPTLVGHRVINSPKGTPVSVMNCDVTWEDTGLYPPEHKTAVVCPACGNPNAHRMGVDVDQVYYCPGGHIVISREGNLTIQEL